LYVVLEKENSMNIRKLKASIYRKLQQLIFWRKILFYVDEVIVPPDFEMWALYKQGADKPHSLHPTVEHAIALQEILNEALKSQHRNKGPK